MWVGSAGHSGLPATASMKFLLFTLSVVGCVLAEAPYPQPRKPEGALLLLPPEYSRKSEYNYQPFQSEAEDLDKISAKTMKRLGQEQGAGSGSYHVYLSDGRLQKVQYTTAPLRRGEAPVSEQASSGGLDPVIAQFGRLQQQFQEQQIQQLQQRQQQLEQQQQELQKQQEELRSASYVASLRYSNVEPITSPIYSYKPSPVTRILRYAPLY